MRLTWKSVSPQLALWLVGIGAVLFNFRYQLRNGTQLLSGDRYDGFIATAILEHWHNVFRGLSSWATTNFFYPHPYTLGYNDGYLLYGVIYSAFRAIGTDAFLSAELVNVSLRAFGFAAFYSMGRSVFGWTFGWSVFGAALFTLANSIFIHAHHTQLFAVCFVPAFALLLARSGRAFWSLERGRFIGYGLTSAAFFGAWLLTAYYMAWYCAFFALVLLISLATLSSRQQLSDSWARARAMLSALLIVGLGAILAIAPFAWLYLPKAAETGMHSYSVALSFAPNLLDTFNVGPGNVVWAWLIRLVNSALGASGFSTGEPATGMPPGLVVAFLVSCVVLARWRSTEPDRVPKVILAIALTSVVTWGLTLRLGDTSGWWFVYHLVPGAKAARAVSRYQIFLVVPVIITVVSTLALVRDRNRWMLGALCTLLLLENANTLPPLGVARFREVARLEAIGRPPSECRYFFASSARPTSLYGAETDARYSHNVDAMLVAEVTGVPTINGIASFSPPWWDLFHAEAPDYRARVFEHMKRFGLAAPCELDLHNSRWTSRGNFR